MKYTFTRKQRNAMMYDPGAAGAKNINGMLDNGFPVPAPALRLSVMDKPKRKDMSGEGGPEKRGEGGPEKGWEGTTKKGWEGTTEKGWEGTTKKKRKFSGPKKAR